MPHKVKIKAYFCRVLPGKNILAAIALLFLMAPCPARASGGDALFQSWDIERDSITISLLTCSPGNEVYSLYGHTAIRCTNHTRNDDVIVNYGMFSFHKPFFILRFIFGLTDYEMGVEGANEFGWEYFRQGRSVLQQDINLTGKEKAGILLALRENYREGNRVYRYNYFFDNCTTRARDMILSGIGGSVEYPGAEPRSRTFRQYIHGFNGDHPWARFGNDMLLGFGTDRKATPDESQFLPYNLKEDFDLAVIREDGGGRRRLVGGSGYVVRPGPVETGKEFPLDPGECAWVVFGVVALLSALEIATGRNFWPLDTVLMALDGCVGLLLFVMLFSEHPTTSTNLQIFLFNPLALALAWKVSGKAARGRRTRAWHYAILSLLAYFIGGIFQDYAEGTHVLALSLLVRCALGAHRQRALARTEKTPNKKARK